MAGSANKVVIVNGGATGLTTTTGQLALGGNLTVTGAFNTILAQSASTTLTLPGVSGTLATLAGTETLTNKTILNPSITAPSGLTSADVGLGNVDNTSDATKNAAVTTLTNKTLTTPTINGGTITSSTISGPTFSGTASGSLTSLALTNPVITTGTVTADPAASLGIVSKQYADQHGFTTGDVKLTIKTVADTSWVLMNDGTIGSATCGCSTRSNADTVDLYTLIWTNFVDQWAPVTGGRGGSAAADFAANKPLALPKTLGRALAGYGVGTTKETFTASSANGFTSVTNNTKWVTGMPIVISALSGFTTTATAGPTYYVVRISSTNVRLATTLALAQNNTPDITLSGSGSATFTYTFTSRAIGEQAGEEAHAGSITELLAHAHSGTSVPTNNVPGGSAPNLFIGNGTNASSIGTTSTGGNVVMNIMQPTIFLNVMVKL
jgi:hypothetical protein